MWFGGRDVEWVQESEPLLASHKSLDGHTPPSPPPSPPDLPTSSSRKCCGKKCDLSFMYGRMGITLTTAVVFFN
eukprot:2000365-Prymnesium_polylepis.1